MGFESGTNEMKEKWSESVAKVFETVSAEIREEAARNEHFSPAVRAHILTAIQLNSEKIAFEILDRSTRYGSFDVETQVRNYLNGRVKAAVADVLPTHEREEEIVALEKLFQRILLKQNITE